MKDYIVVTFHTQDDIYRDYAKNLSRSMIDLGIPFIMEQVDRTDKNWKDIIYLKPEFIRKWARRLEETLIIWTDIDANFLRYPRIFDEAAKNMDSFDVLVQDFNHHRRKEVTSAIFGISANRQGLAFLDEWVELCKSKDKSINSGDQWWFNKILEKQTYRRKILPWEYEVQPGWSPSPPEPIHMHFASEHWRDGRYEKYGPHLSAKSKGKNGIKEKKRLSD